MNAKLLLTALVVALSSVLGPGLAQAAPRNEPCFKDRLVVVMERSDIAPAIECARFSFKRASRPKNRSYSASRAEELSTRLISPGPFRFITSGAGQLFFLAPASNQFSNSPCPVGSKLPFYPLKRVRRVE